MKMPADAFAALEALIDRNIPAERRVYFADLYAGRGISAERLRWDLFYSIPYIERDEWFSTYRIYDSMNDTHVDTALRRIFKH